MKKLSSRKKIINAKIFKKIIKIKIKINLIIII